MSNEPSSSKNVIDNLQGQDLDDNKKLGASPFPDNTGIISAQEAPESPTSNPVMTNPEGGHTVRFAPVRRATHIMPDVFQSPPQPPTAWLSQSAPYMSSPQAYDPRIYLSPEHMVTGLGGPQSPWSMPVNYQPEVAYPPPQRPQVRSHSLPTAPSQEVEPPPRPQFFTPQVERVPLSTPGSRSYQQTPVHFSQSAPMPSQPMPTPMSMPSQPMSMPSQPMPMSMGPMPTNSNPRPHRRRRSAPAEPASRARQRKEVLAEISDSFVANDPFNVHADIDGEDEKKITFDDIDLSPVQEEWNWGQLQGYQNPYMQQQPWIPPQSSWDQPVPDSPSSVPSSWGQLYSPFTMYPTTPYIPYSSLEATPGWGSASDVYPYPPGWISPDTTASMPSTPQEPITPPSRMSSQIPSVAVTFPEPTVPNIIPLRSNPQVTFPIPTVPTFPTSEGGDTVWKPLPIPRAHGSPKQSHTSGGLLSQEEPPANSSLETTPITTPPVIPPISPSPPTPATPATPTIPPIPPITYPSPDTPTIPPIPATPYIPNISMTPEIPSIPISPTPSPSGENVNISISPPSRSPSPSESYASSERLSLHEEQTADDKLANTPIPIPEPVPGEPVPETGQRQHSPVGSPRDSPEIQESPVEEETKEESSERPPAPIYQTYVTVNPDPRPFGPYTQQYPFDSAIVGPDFYPYYYQVQDSRTATQNRPAPIFQTYVTVNPDSEHFGPYTEHPLTDPANMGTDVYPYYYRMQNGHNDEIVNIPEKPSFWNNAKDFLCWPFAQRASLLPYYVYPLPTNTRKASPRFTDIAIQLLATTVPRQVYLHVLLRLPSLYFSRVARIFEEAALTLREIKKMALETGLTDKDKDKDKGSGGGGAQVDFYTFDSSMQDVTVPPQYRKLKLTWEAFIDSVMREWKTFNIISVLLLSAILTILQIQSAAENPITRYTALSSLICALISLLFGCTYIIRFGTMRKATRAAEWALEANQTKTTVWWNVWVLLAMPAIWLTWSIILYIVCIMSFVWQSSAGTDQNPPNEMSAKALLAVRVIMSTLLGLGIVYGVLILSTFRRYGQKMDDTWKRRINGWMLEKRNKSRSYRPFVAGFDPRPYYGGSSANFQPSQSYRTPATPAPATLTPFGSIYGPQTPATLTPFGSLYGAQTPYQHPPFPAFANPRQFQFPGVTPDPETPSSAPSPTPSATPSSTSSSLSELFYSGTGYFSSRKGSFAAEQPQSFFIPPPSTGDKDNEQTEEAVPSASLFLPSDHDQTEAKPGVGPPSLPPTRRPLASATEIPIHAMGDLIDQNNGPGHEDENGPQIAGSGGRTKEKHELRTVRFRSPLVSPEVSHFEGSISGHSNDEAVESGFSNLPDGSLFANDSRTTHPQTSNSLNMPPSKSP